MKLSLSLRILLQVAAWIPAFLCSPFPFLGKAWKVQLPCLYPAPTVHSYGVILMSLSSSGCAFKPCRYVLQDESKAFSSECTLADAQHPPEPAWQLKVLTVWIESHPVMLINTHLWHSVPSQTSVLKDTWQNGCLLLEQLLVGPKQQKPFFNQISGTQVSILMSLFSASIPLLLAQGWSCCLSTVLLWGT